MPKLPTIVTVAIVALVLALVLAALLFRLRNRRATDEPPWPYYLRRLLTSPEQVLFHRLVAALPGLFVLSQVQVSRVLGVSRGVPVHTWPNRINRLSYDFVICSPDGTVLAAIELDDDTHQRPERFSADYRKDRASAAAGLRLIRWHVRDLPDAATIASSVLTPDPPIPFAGRREPTL